MRYLTEDNRAPMPAPTTDHGDVAGLVPAAVDEILRRAETWLAWDGRPTHARGNVWTPHKALRRVSDHLIEHIAEIECRLAGVPTIPDQWHGRRLTLDGDWARFTEADLDEATSRLTRLAAMYRARVAGLGAETLDARGTNGEWTLREVVAHVAGVVGYAKAMDGD